MQFCIFHFTALHSEIFNLD